MIVNAEVYFGRNIRPTRISLNLEVDWDRILCACLAIPSVKRPGAGLCQRQDPGARGGCISCSLAISEIGPVFLRRMTCPNQAQKFLNTAYLQLIVIDQGPYKPCRLLVKSLILRVCKVFWQNRFLPVRNYPITEPVPPALSRGGNRSPALSEADGSLGLVLLHPAPVKCGAPGRRKG